MQHHEEEDMTQLKRLELYTVRNANRGVHTSVTLRDQNTRVHDAEGEASRQPTRPDASVFERGLPKRVASRVVGINSRCCGRGCTCILLLIRSYFFELLGLYVCSCQRWNGGAHTVHHNYHTIGCVT